MSVLKLLGNSFIQQRKNINKTACPLAYLRESALHTHTHTYTHTHTPTVSLLIIHWI